MTGGMTREPDRDDPAQMFVHRVMDAVQREFAGDDQVPRFVINVEMPPEGRIAIASTGDNDVDTHRMLALAAAAVRAGMSPAGRERARQEWRKMRAGFENE